MHTVTLLIPFIAICLMGYGAIRFGLLTQTHSDALAKICFNILIPLFLFRSTYLTDLDTNISFTWFLSFYLPVIACFIFVYGVCRYTLKRGTASATIKALVGNYSNTVLIAIPILASVLPLEVAGQGFVIIGLHSAILFTLTELLMRGISPKAILGGLNNPIVVSIFAGLFCNLIDLPIPELLF